MFHRIAIVVTSVLLVGTTARPADAGNKCAKWVEGVCVVWAAVATPADIPGRGSYAKGKRDNAERNDLPHVQQVQKHTAKSPPPPPKPTKRTETSSTKYSKSQRTLPRDTARNAKAQNGSRGFDRGSRGRGTAGTSSKRKR